MGDRGGVNLSSRWRCGKDELVDRKLKPNFLPGLGGRGGGLSSIELVLVLPV